MERGRLPRRLFLTRILMAAGASFVAPVGVRGMLTPQEKATEDERIFHEKMQMAARQGLGSKPIGDIVATLGLSFLGVPYAAHTLEEPGIEHLVVNLREFDCTTFMENSLVLARCVKRRVTSFEEYKLELQFVRYRSGIVDGYPSRLHYFSEWVADNEKKLVLQDMSKKLGGKQPAKQIGFMSAHPSVYRQLSDSVLVEKIRQNEKALNARGYVFLERDRIASALDRIRNGDIIGIATSMEGMDVSHTGIAVRSGTTVRFLHAPLSGGAVEISRHSLAEYVLSHKATTGVVVARPLEPA